MDEHNFVITKGLGTDKLTATHKECGQSANIKTIQTGPGIVLMIIECSCGLNKNPVVPMMDAMQVAAGMEHSFTTKAPASGKETKFIFTRAEA